MLLPYHPIAAFGLLYTIGLLLLLSGLGLAGLMAPAAIAWLVDKGIVNILPMALVFMAARRSALLDGRPLFRFVTDDGKAFRKSLRQHIWLWAVSFGLAGVIADLASVAIAAIVQAEAFHYSMLRLLALAAVYAFVAQEGIKSTFGPDVSIAAQRVMETPNTRHAVPIEDRPPDR